MRLRLAERGDEPRLFAAMQDYLREMAPLYGDEPDENGVYPYPWLPYYFEEPRRLPYLIYNDDEWAGFALVNDHTFRDDPADHTIAEFTIFPARRCAGLGLAAVRALFDLHPGRWQLKFSVRNESGMRFWEKATAPYAPSVRELNEHERRLTFNVAPRTDDKGDHRT
ncbi:MAG: GNAT family N-acetyltransferase [Ruminococcaceae bacterium]|nr:GNAT family N-acetyltransferase [Oscillospiraceae bacterium]